MSEERQSFRPVTALTMGDPAGIGPEICIGTMMSPMIHEKCRPFVIGSIPILERALKALRDNADDQFNKDYPGAEVTFRKISDPSEARFERGVIDVMETGDYDTDSIRWGEVQKLAGQMAYDFIVRSIELGLAKKVDAVSTAPINKQAIKLVGVKEPGHTEIYQHMTNSKYALTMFSCHKLRVFFVSRHLSLMDAIKFASRSEILKDVIDINTELKKVGIAKPKIAVAGLNPHNGDNGLFGTEEITDIGPAVEDAKKAGIDCVGPLPADSLFNDAKDGRYDAILSLYHDQGHIACKTYDFEGSVTLTFGLPFIRSSVDHGTAFALAGKGTAQYRSMIESTKVVSEYAARMHENAVPQTGNEAAAQPENEAAAIA